MNPLGNGMSPQFMQNIQQIKNMMKSLNNPSLAMQNNPQMQQVMQMCQGKNPKDVFYSMCKQQGINPEQLINMLNS